MSILSDKPEKLIREDYDVSVQLNKPELNHGFINIRELGLTYENVTLPEHTFNITRRLMELFEGMSVEVLDTNILQASVSNILTCPGWVMVDKEAVLSAIIITYRHKETDKEILTISLRGNKWVC